MGYCGRAAAAVALRSEVSRGQRRCVACAAQAAFCAVKLRHMAEFSTRGRASSRSHSYLTGRRSSESGFWGTPGRCSEWGGEITAAVGASPTDGGATPNTNRRRWGIAAALLSGRWVGRTRPLHAASLPGARPLANSSRSRLRASPLQLVRAPPSSPAPQRPPSPRLLFRNQHRRLSHLIHHESNPQQVMSRSRTGTARAPSRSARSAGHRRAPRDPPVPEGAPLLPPCLHAPSINARPRDRPGLQN